MSPLETSQDIENYYDETRCEQVGTSLILYGESISFPKSAVYASPEFKLLTIDLLNPVKINIDCEDMPIIELDGDCIYLTQTTAELLKV